MKFVEPIKEIEQINKIKQYLKQKSARDYLFFVLGINTGLRVNEMLKMKISDVMNDNGEIKEMFVLTDEQKEKVKLFYLNEKVKEALRLYFSQIHINLRNEHLFKSKKDPFQSISRQQAYRIVNSAARQIGLVENIGTHTLRKTFGYHAYKRGIAISILQNIFNHGTPSETLRYICIDQHEEHFVKVDVNL